MTLRLRNTLTRQTEPVYPIEPGRVGSMAQLDPTAAIAPSAVPTGDVTLGEHAPEK